MQCSKLALGKRITARITKANERVEAQLASRDDIQEIQEYRGYSVTVEECPFGEIVENRGFDLAVATSRYGVPFGNVAAEMAEKWKAANTVLVAFGAPRQGLQEIVRQEGLNLDDLMDYVINTIPRQGTETVRTEEALVASLAILNVLVL
jgi:predicted SPOUT superfamily RNA methylase MTH1